MDALRGVTFGISSFAALVTLGLSGQSEDYIRLLSHVLSPLLTHFTVELEGKQDEDIMFALTSTMKKFSPHLQHLCIVMTCRPTGPVSIQSIAPLLSCRSICAVDIRRVRLLSVEDAMLKTIVDSWPLLVSLALPPPGSADTKNCKTTTLGLLHLANLPSLATLEIAIPTIGAPEPNVVATISPNLSFRALALHIVYFHPSEKFAEVIDRVFSNVEPRTLKFRVGSRPTCRRFTHRHHM